MRMGCQGRNTRLYLEENLAEEVEGIPVVAHKSDLMIIMEMWLQKEQKEQEKRRLEEQKEQNWRRGNFRNRKN